jgi:serine/threonine protein kinase
MPPDPAISHAILDVMSRALGRYELLRPLARGGMAEVYLARRRTAGIEKWLVVKRIRPERSGDARFLDLFVREARLSMSLVHQNIVPVFDFGRIDDQVFLAMERVEGKDLGSTLARAAGRRVSPLIAAFIAAECCQALDYAHHRKSPEGAFLGIVHRDVTPRNVLLSWSGEVKLTDFGIAALAGEATAKLLGTPAYMAPEQARSEPLDARADVYAVGLLLREMLTGQRARPGSEREQFIEAAKVGTMHPWPDDLSSPLVAIVDRATSIRPEDRFPDARRMLEELDSVIVAERAARKSEAPARLLAAWLHEVWSGDDDDRSADTNIEANHLVSFLDDGALDVVGTGTERSLLATAADEPVTASGSKQTPAVSPSDDEDVAPSSKVEVRPSAQVLEAPAPRAASNPGLVSSPEQAHLVTGTGSQTALPARRASTMAIALMVVGAAGLGALAMLVLRDDKSPERTAAVTPPTTLPIVTAPPPVADPPPVANPPPVAETNAGSATSAPPPSTPTSDGRTRPPTGQHRPPSGQSRTKPPANTEPATATVQPVTLRRVTINATPWAYFTIDDDGTQHETMKTIMLAPGKHRVHFTNPVLKVERDVTIDVPTDRDTSHVERLGS